MDTKKVLSEIKEIENQLDAIQEQKKALRDQLVIRLKEYSNYIGEKYTGLKIGDTITFTRKAWRRSKNVTMRVTGFDAYIRDDGSDDESPTIQGIRVLKNGEVGVRTEAIYKHEKINWKKQ